MYTVLSLGVEVDGVGHTTVFFFILFVVERSGGFIFVYEVPDRIREGHNAHLARVAFVRSQKERKKRSYCTTSRSVGRYGLRLQRLQYRGKLGQFPQVKDFCKKPPWCSVHVVSITGFVYRCKFPGEFSVVCGTVVVVRH